MWQDGRTHSLELTCHPTTPAPAVRRIVAHADRPGLDLLSLRFVVDGDLGRLRIPSPETARRGERLWEHTCCEAFIATFASTAYHEVNLSPAGVWAMHAFRRYRDGGPLLDDRLAPRVSVRRDADRLAVEAVLELGRLAPAAATTALRVALAAVIEAEDGTLSYWALRHPPGRPDFHHDDGFALVLDAPGPGAGARPS